MKRTTIYFLFLIGWLWGCKNNEPVKFVNVYKDPAFDNGPNIKYYIRDSVTRKFRQVNMPDVYPVDMKDPNLR